jgi:hypothetical protein
MQRVGYDTVQIWPPCPFCLREEIRKTFPSRKSFRVHLWAYHKKDLRQVRGVDQYVDLTEEEYVQKSHKARLRWMGSAERRRYYQEYGAWKDAQRDAGSVSSEGSLQTVQPVCLRPPPCASRGSCYPPVDLRGASSSSSSSGGVSVDSDGHVIDDWVDEWCQDPPEISVDFPVAGEGDPDAGGVPSGEPYPDMRWRLSPLPVESPTAGRAVGGCSDVPLPVSVDDAPPLPVLPPSPSCSSPFPDASLSSIIPPPPLFADSSSPVPAGEAVAMAGPSMCRPPSPSCDEMLAAASDGSGGFGADPGAQNLTGIVGQAADSRSSTPVEEVLDVTSAAIDGVIPVVVALTRVSGSLASVEDITEAVARSSPTVERSVIRHLVRTAVASERQLAATLHNVMGLAAMVDPSGRMGLLQVTATLLQILSRPE